MQKKTCPNGHVYDPSIYGDQCPMCPKGGGYFSGVGGGTQIDPSFSAGGVPPMSGTQTAFDGHTHIGKPMESAEASMGFGPMPAKGPVGKTKMMPKEAQPSQPQAGGAMAGHTMIRRPGNSAQAVGRKLVGFLVTYNRNPLGKSYNIYEGRNYIGRDSNCDICIADDAQMSGRHMSILYRSVDNKFKFRDEQSSNGTFVNKQLLDDGELENYDIIRVGSTLFIFIAIPKIG